MNYRFDAEFQIHFSNNMYNWNVRNPALLKNSNLFDNQRESW